MKRERKYFSYKIIQSLIHNDYLLTTLFVYSTIKKPRVGFCMLQDTEIKMMYFGLLVPFLVDVCLNFGDPPNLLYTYSAQHTSVPPTPVLRKWNMWMYQTAQCHQTKIHRAPVFCFLLTSRAYPKASWSHSCFKKSSLVQYNEKLQFHIQLNALSFFLSWGMTKGSPLGKETWSTPTPPHSASVSTRTGEGGGGTKKRKQKPLQGKRPCRISVLHRCYTSHLPKLSTSG